MPNKKKSNPARGSKKAAKHSLEDEVQSVLASLKRSATKGALEGMARYGIPSDNACGVSMKNIQALAKSLGRNHELAAALWETGWYEARMLTAYIDEPARVTSTQMDRWCRDFDNWAICDTLCFALWDRTPHAWGKVAKWAGRREEFVRRTAFALLWSLTAHDKVAAVAVAQRLAASPEAAARWVGKDALRELTSPAVIGRLARSSKVGTENSTKR